MLIQVIYQNDKRFGAVHKFRLEKLIASGQLFAFRRANDWVIIEKDPIRGAGGSYSGPERRSGSSGTGGVDEQALTADVELNCLESECLQILKSYNE